MKKELLYVIAFLLFGNPINANLNTIDSSSLEKATIKCSSKNVGAVKGRTDEEVILNINNFIQIESSGHSWAYNKGSGARGLMQIVPTVLDEWNHHHPSQKYEIDDLFNSEINIEIGTWYLDRIKNHYLPHYGLKDSIENIITAYNWGIGNLRNTREERDKDRRNGGEGEFHIPSGTIKYIRRYKEMQDERREEIETVVSKLNLSDFNSSYSEPIKTLKRCKRER